MKVKINPGDVFEGELVEVRFTSGSPFGEQWSTIQLDNGDTVSIATWIDYSAAAKNSPRRGDRVRVTAGQPMSCHIGFCKIHCSPCSHNVIKIDG